MAFDSNQEEESQGKEALGRQIVNKCPNVPLAIRTIGSFLYSKDKKQWLSFVNNEVMKVLRNTENMIMEALKISYDDLPPSVKHCFTYCSLFPKDYRFDKTTLVHLWMAQGLLQTSAENQSLEDVGEDYFLCLVQRCFFQDVWMDNNGDIESCKMHDLFHDLASQMGENECLMKIKFLDDFTGKFPPHLLVGDLKQPVLQGKGLRSLVSLNVGYINRALLDGVFSNLTRLRTLSLRNLDVEEIPSSIGKLVHMRYLDLMKSEKLKQLPNSVCKLQHLLILRLGGCLNLIKLPDDLQNLISLRYMEIKGCDMLNHLPSGLEKMTSLVMLDRFVVNKDNGGLRCLKHLNNLAGALHIELPLGQWKNCLVDAEESVLGRKSKLSKLAISFGDSRGGQLQPSNIVVADAVLERLQPPNNISSLRVEYFHGVKFPDWLYSLTNLVDLKLSSCHSFVELPHLRQLYQLKRMELWETYCVEYVMNDPCSDTGPFFPSLEELYLWVMPSLKGLCRPAVTGGEVCYANQLWFPRLTRLHVAHCPHLTWFPLCPCVERLMLVEVNGNLVTSLLRAPREAREGEANNTAVVPSSSSLQTCSKLHSLYLHRIEDLALLPDEFQLFPCLCEFRIMDCPNFKRRSLFNSLQYIPRLESLHFNGSGETELHNDENWEKEGMSWVSLTRLKRLSFEFGSDREGAHLVKGLHHLTMLEDLSLSGNVPDDAQWTAPPNIKYLDIQHMNKVAALNGLLQQLKRLQLLSFSFCKKDGIEWDELQWEGLKGLRRLMFQYCNMKSLPEKCRHLPTLEDLTLNNCFELTCLPTWVTQLKSLTMGGQFPPELKEKCRKPMGSYWPLIGDIPHLTIDFYDFEP